MCGSFEGSFLRVFTIPAVAALPSLVTISATQATRGTTAPEKARRIADRARSWTGFVAVILGAIAAIVTGAIALLVQPGCQTVDVALRQLAIIANTHRTRHGCEPAETVKIDQCAVLYD